MATKDSGNLSTSRPSKVSMATIPAGPLPNKMLHKLGDTRSHENPYDTGKISTIPTTKGSNNPTGY